MNNKKLKSEIEKWKNLRDRIHSIPGGPFVCVEPEDLYKENMLIESKSDDGYCHPYCSEFLSLSGLPSKKTMLFRSCVVIGFVVLIILLEIYAGYTK